MQIDSLSDGATPVAGSWHSPVGGFFDPHELKVIWWSMAAAILAVCCLELPWLFVPGRQGWLLLTAAFLLLGFSRWAIERGRLQWACWSLVGPGWLLFAVLSALRGGVNDVAATFMISFAIVAGLLLGRRAAVALFLASCAVIAFEAATTMQGVSMPYRLPPATRDFDALLFLLSAGIVLVALYLVQRRLAFGELVRKNEATARQMAENEARRAQVNLMGLTAHLPIALVFFDAELRFKSANQAFFEFFPELAPASLNLKTVRNLFHHFSSPSAVERVAQLAPGDTFSFDAPHVECGKDFKGFEVRISRGSAEVDNEVSVLIIDQTVRLRQLTEISRKERIYRQLVDALPVGIVTYLDYRINFANAAAARIMGRPSPASMIGSHVMELFPGSEDNVRMRTYRAQRLGEPQPPVRRRLQKQDGSEAIIETAAAPFGTDESLGVLSIFIDVTESVRAEEARRIAEQRVRATIENAPNVAAQWFTRSGHIVYWNAACERMWGIAAEHAIGRTIAEVRGPHVADFVENAMRHVEATGRPLGPTEFVSNHPDGTEIRLLCTVFAIPGEHDEPCFARMSIDITELHAARKALRDTNAALESKVAARTAELVTSNSDLDAFASSVSHDLRAPIRYTLMLIERLKAANAEGQTADMSRYLDLLADVCRRMGDIVEALLNFAREGRSALIWSRVPLEALVHEIVREQEAQATHGKNIRWHIVVESDARGDIGLIRIVLGNIIGNAVKFTAKRDQPVIEVSASCKGEWIEVSVNDNGAGFDPRYAHRLFAFFSRLHSASEFEGLGIGLVTSQRIVSRHGGTILAEGRPDQGATFRFTLPVWSEAVPPPADDLLAVLEAPVTQDE